MDDARIPVLIVLLAATVTAVMVYRYVPSREALSFRMMLARVSARRAFTACLHAFDADARRLDRYAWTMGDLEQALEMRDGVEKRIADDLGPGASSQLRGLPPFQMLEDHLDRCQARATAHLAAMTDKDVAAVARMFQRGPFEGVAPLRPIAKFLEDERNLARTMPHMVRGHFDRMTERFNAIQAEQLVGMPLP